MKKIDCNNLLSDRQALINTFDIISVNIKKVRRYVENANLMKAIWLLNDICNFIDDGTKKLKEEQIDSNE